MNNLYHFVYQNFNTALTWVNYDRIFAGR